MSGYPKTMNLSVFNFRTRAPALLLALVALVVVSLPAHAQRTFSMRYTTTVPGDIVGIGNVNMNCASFTAPPAPSANCTSSRTHTGGSGNFNNNSFTMVNTDVDSDSTTFNSSRATLNLPSGSTVLFAGLYWSGRGTAAGRNAVRLATPTSGYADITAQQFDVVNGRHQGFTNVTSQVAAAGNGVYTVANVVSESATDSWAGWALVVAYTNASLPTRNLSVFDGWQLANDVGQPINLGISGFLTPPTGPVNSTLGVLAWDGDRNSVDGAAGLQFGPTIATLVPVSDGINPVDNFWNSTISLNGAHVTTGRTPAYTNTLGMDLDFLPPNTQLPNGATSAVVQVRGTSSEHIYPGMVSLVTDVYAPDLVSSITKTVVDDNGGDVEPGDVLTYTINFTNSGQDGATNVLVTDPIPAGTTYVPDSLVVLTNNTNDGGSTNGGATGAMTDASDGDVAEFSGGDVVFRLGIDDSAHDGGIGVTNGGMISAGYSGSFEFKVMVNSDAVAGATISNTATVTHNAQTIPNFDATGTASATTTLVDEVDLSIVKTVNPTTAAIGETVTYVLEVGNAGPASVQGAIVRDPAVDGLDCSAAVLACSVTGDAECPASPTIAGLQGSGLVIPVLPVGGNLRVEFSCVVTGTP